MKTLVYVGANRGETLSRVVDRFDRIIAFEPEPDTFQDLVTRLGSNPKIMFVNAACSDENGEADLYVTVNGMSNSLAMANHDTLVRYGPGHFEITKICKVSTVNLHDFLMERGITNVDVLHTDAQGKDLDILKTIMPMIRTRSISRLICETNVEGLPAYSGLYNGINGYQDLLDEHYTLSGIVASDDWNHLKPLADLEPGREEFDAVWDRR